MKYKEGDRYICPKCESEVIVKKITYHGEEKLSHRNPDGTPHFWYDGKKVIHTPTKKTELEVRMDEILDRLSRVERALGVVVID